MQHSYSPLKYPHNQFAVGFHDRTVKLVYWDGISSLAIITGNIFEVQQDTYYNENLWHMVKTDPVGRFYGGTMPIQLCTHSSAPDGSF